MATNESTTAAPAAAAAPPDKPRSILVGSGEGICRFDHGLHDVVAQLPLPGVVIFVHGVNSDGEWYQQAEEGLCAGLNKRLARGDGQLVHRGVNGGQLAPMNYIDELTGDGFLNPEMNSQSFIVQDEQAYSPVIRFRWGYKASGEELQKYGRGIYLNEKDYWGGGPFANGCSALADLWGDGLDEGLFLWLHVQHLNPTSDRQVYSCPPRPYFVLGALRLAKLVESLRRLQADLPITIVCHSQGNMVGMAAAFMGDAMADATDAAGRSGRCVADTYVLCNPPYSLAEGNFSESWTERGMVDSEGRSGRQTLAARTRTLARFFDILRRRAPLQQDAARVDRLMANEAHGFTAAADCARHGLGGSTCGRVTLYCNPHDQVISATAIQGIGWRGMSAAEIAATAGAGTFTQRVFAQGFMVGDPTRTSYDCWADHHKKPAPGSADFWVPRSQLARYSLTNGWKANSNPLGWVMTLLATPIIAPVVAVGKIPINELPPRDWKLPLQAPPLPEPFEPQALRFGVESPAFDEKTDAPGRHRDRRRVREKDDPYADDPEAAATRSDAAAGDEKSEASLRYEHHAQLRMEARRGGFPGATAPRQSEPEPYAPLRGDGRRTDAAGQAEENRPDETSAEYQRWRRRRIPGGLKNEVQHPPASLDG